MRERRWRRIRVAALAILASLIAIAALLAVSIHTEPARELARRRIETAAGDAIRGSLRIGKIEGSPFGALGFEDLEIRDAEGEVILRARRLELEPSLRALARGDIVIRRLEAREVVLRAVERDDGSWSVEGLLPPERTPAGGAEGPPPSISIDELSIVEAAIIVDRKRSAQRAEGERRPITEAKRRRAGKGKRSAQRAEGERRPIAEAKRRRAGKWPEDRITLENVSIAGRLALADRTLRIESASIDAGGSSVGISAASFGLDRGDLEGRIRAHLELGELGAIANVPKLGGSLALDAKVETRGSAYDVSLSGDLSGAPFSARASLTKDARHVSAAMRIDGLDVGRVFEGVDLGARSLALEARGPVGDLHVSARAEGIRASGTPIGDLELEAHGVSAEHASIEARIRGPEVHEAHAVAELHRTGDELRADVSRLELSGDFGRWESESPSSWVLDPSGVLWVTALTLTSPTGRLTIGGRIDTRDPLGSGTRIEGRIREARMSALGRPLGLRIGGSADAEISIESVEGSRSARLEARLLRLELDGNLLAEKATLAAALRADRVTARIASAGGLAGTLEAAVVLRAPSDLLDVGVWKPLRRRVERFSATLAGTDLARLAVLLAADVEIAGTVRGEVTAGASGSPIRARLEVEGLETPGAPAANAEIRAEVEERKTRVRIEAGFEPIDRPIFMDLIGRRRTTNSHTEADLVPVAGDRTEPALAADFDLDAGLAEIERRGPRALLDAPGRAAISLRGLPITAVAGPLTSTSAPYALASGVIDVTATATRSGSSLEAAAVIDVEGARLQGDESGRHASSARVSASLDRDGGLTANATIAVGARGRITLFADVAAPDRPLSAGEWRAMDRRAIQAATLEARDLPLEILEDAGVALPWLRGRFDATADLGSRAAHGRATLGVRGLSAPAPLALDAIEAKAEIELAPEKITGTLEAWSAGAPRRALLEAKAELGEGLFALLDGASSAEVRGLATMDRLPLPAALGDIALESKIEGDASGSIAVSGEIRSPIVDASLDLSGARLAGVGFSRFDVTGRAENGRLDARLHVAQEEGGSLEGSADIDTTEGGERRAMLTASEFDLSFLSSIAAVVAGTRAAIAGVMNGRLEASGPPASPALSGALEIDDASFLLPGLFPPIEGSRLHVGLDRGRLHVEAEGRAGGGTYVASADCAVDRWDAGSCDGSAKTKEVRIITPKVALEASGRAIARAAREGDHLTASVELEEVVVELPDAGRDLHPVRDLPPGVVFVGEDEKEPEPSPRQLACASLRLSASARLRLAARSACAKSESRLAVAIEVSSRNPIVIRGEEVDATAVARMRLASSPAGLATSGEASIREGRITLFGQPYSVERAEAVFDGSVPPDPHLDILLARDVGTARLYVTVAGSSKKPRVRFSSEPPIYDQSELLAFFLGGTPEGGASIRALEEQAVGAAAGLVMSRIQTRLKRALPFDVLRVDVSEATTDAAARVTLGKWLSDRLFVAYTYRPSATEEENVSEGTLRYRFFRALVFEAVFGDHGSGSADVLWVKRF